MKKSVVAIRACWSFSRQTAASSEVSVPTSSSAKDAAGGIRVRMSCSTAGAILQPQPPPWAREVRRGSSASLMAKVWAKPVVNSMGRTAPACAALIPKLHSWPRSAIVPLPPAGSAPMIIVHHLNDSRSQRVLWLLEELGLAYEVKRYQRDPQTMLAPAELKAVHPLGKSPV